MFRVVGLAQVTVLTGAVRYIVGHGNPRTGTLPHFACELQDGERRQALPWSLSTEWHLLQAIASFHLPIAAPASLSFHPIFKR
jgi:hypothetical protein